LLRNVKRGTGYRGKVGFNIDVGAAVLAEFKLGNHGVKNSLAYVTIGTGVGISLYSNGGVYKGISHTEGGHMSIKRLPEDNFKGTCPFHGDCIEGLISNKAIASRMNIDY